MRGFISGVLKQEPGETEKRNLLVNGTTPNVSKPSTKTLQAVIEDSIENQKNSDSTGDIGFYVGCELGMAFTQRNLEQAIVCYRNFRNSVMIVYDLNKSQYGLSPLTCFRLSQLAITTLYLEDLTQLTSTLVQDRLNEQGLEVSSLFEKVDMKIYRSHLLQAFLFDHISPNLPSFNPQMFALGSDS